jgi:hypothetical protein
MKLRGSRREWLRARRKFEKSCLGHHRLYWHLGNAVNALNVIRPRNHRKNDPPRTHRVIERLDRRLAKIEKKIAWR